MIVNGVDIIEIARIRKISEKYGKRFLKRIYTEGEIGYCRGRAPQLASRFAAKEAVMKALGTGVIGIRWKDVEIIRKGGSRPLVKLHGTALHRAQTMQIQQLSISLSHSDEHAIAFVIGESQTMNN